MIEHLPKDQIFIRKLSEIIQANLRDENFGIKELAHELDMSHYSLRRRLYAITNKTFKQYIREARLQKAFKMLQNEELTVSEVAYKVGFSSPAYFNTCFHEFFGYPPGKVSKGVFNNAEELNSVLITEDQKQKGRVSSTILIITSGILFLSVLVFMVFNFFIKNPSSNKSIPINNPEKSIAVLPFKNLSDTLANQYFIDGLMEEILTNLSKIRDLRVISRTSVEQFRRSDKSASEIGKNLKVDYIVEGSGQKYGNTFRLRVQLIAVNNEKHLWAESFEQELKETKDFFRIQSQIAQSIASELKVAITPEEQQIIETIPTTNLTAYDFYQRGKEELSKLPWPQFNPEILKKAVTLFRTALEYDSTFARAYSSLGGALWTRLDLDQNITETNIRNKLIDSLLVLSDMALSYDDKLAEAYIIKSVYYGYKLNLKMQIEELDKAIRYNPNDWMAYFLKGIRYDESDKLKSFKNFHKAASLGHGPELNKILVQLAFRYYNVGFPEMGDHFYLEVLKLDGDSIVYFARKFNSQGAISGNYQKSIEFYKKRYLTDSTKVNVLIRLGYFNSLIGNCQESLKYFKKYISESEVHGYSDYSSKWGMEYLIGYAFEQNGYRNESDFYFNRSTKTYIDVINSSQDERNNKFYFYRLAGIYAFRGDKRKAYENLNKMNKDQIAGLDEVILIKMDPLFSSIRNEPEFQRIVKYMEASYQAEHERIRKWLDEQGRL
jgi:TolB-like protein/AraC-like DNA-binding protein/tetratricopeptide (TPR) repeat protein